MLEVCLLGTGGMMPLPYRHLTSLMTRLNGSSLMIDCGEATQVAIKKKGWSFKPIDILCITHFHADHISGLPGLLLTMGNSDRTEPLIIIGGKGIGNVVASLRVIAPELPFAVKTIEINGSEADFHINDYNIRAFKVNHNVPCYGYTITVNRLAKFDVERANKLDLPKHFWRFLQNGEAVEYEGKTYTPDMVMGAERSGLKLTYTTDTRPTRSIVENAKDSDLLICEGMYGFDEDSKKAAAYKHMTMEEACKIAKNANVNELWLTHFSPSLNRPMIYENDVKKIFENTYIGKDGMSTVLQFKE